MSTFGEGSQGGEETAAPAAGGDQQQHSCWEDRSATQDVKMNGMIGVSSSVQQLRHCLITQACGPSGCAGTEFGSTGSGSCADFRATDVYSSRSSERGTSIGNRSRSA